MKWGSFLQSAITQYKKNQKIETSRPQGSQWQFVYKNKRKEKAIQHREMQEYSRKSNLWDYRRKSRRRAREEKKGVNSEKLGISRNDLDGKRILERAMRGILAKSQSEIHNRHVRRSNSFQKDLESTHQDSKTPNFSNQLGLVSGFFFFQFSP